MTIHETIKNQIIEAMRAKDAIRLETLRGLTALFSNELIAKGAPVASTATGKPDMNIIADEYALALIKRSVKQRKDSIEQFEKGGRKDLVEKESAELAILEKYLPSMMSRDDIKKLALEKIEKGGTGITAGKLDKASAGKFVGELMRELKGKADGADVKAVVDALIA